MRTEGPAKRIDSASRLIEASPQALYHAFLDPIALVSWLPPDGMTGEMQRFDPKEGGGYRMVLTYDGPEHTPGKYSENSDVVEARFVELVPDVRIVQSIAFVSDDPAFAGPMTMTWDLERAPIGTIVRISCENVPPGISREDHAEGLRSTLDNLAAFVE